MGQHFDLSKTIIGLIGPPSCGKTTQAHNLAKATGLPIFDGGEILRNAATEDSPLARQIGEHQSKGELVPPELKNSLFAHTLNQLGVNARDKNGCILCGYPRQMEELPFFEDYMKNNHLSLAAVVFIDVNEHTYRNRAQKRIADNVKNRTVRNDDEVDKFERRIQAYKEQTIPAIKHFRDLCLLITIDGLPAPEVVTANIIEALTLKLSSKTS